MIPDIYGNYRYARAWVGYLHRQQLIDEDTHNHICLLLAAPRLSKEEAQGIEDAEKLIPLFTKEFEEHLRMIQPSLLPLFNSAPFREYIEIKL